MNYYWSNKLATKNGSSNEIDKISSQIPIVVNRLIHSLFDRGDKSCELLPCNLVNSIDPLKPIIYKQKNAIAKVTGRSESIKCTCKFSMMNKVKWFSTLNLQHQRSGQLCMWLVTLQIFSMVIGLPEDSSSLLFSSFRRYRTIYIFARD